MLEGMQEEMLLQKQRRGIGRARQSGRPSRWYLRLSNRCEQAGMKDDGDDVDAIRMLGSIFGFVG